MSEYYYEMSYDNYDGTIWSLKFKHEIKFSKREFETLCEDALVYAFEIEFKRSDYACDNDLEKTDIVEYLTLRGFEYVNNKMISYCFAPDYYDFDTTNEKLGSWLRRESPKDVPKYLKDENEQKSN